MLPLAVDVVSGLHGLRVLLDELEEHGDVVDLEIALEDCLLGQEGFLLAMRPLLEEELALVSDLHVAELVLDVALHSPLTDTRLQGLASDC